MPWRWQQLARFVACFVHLNDRPVSFSVLRMFPGQRFRMNDRSGSAAHFGSRASLPGDRLTAHTISQVSVVVMYLQSQQQQTAAASSAFYN